MRTKQLIRLGVGMAVWAALIGGAVSFASRATVHRSDTVEAMDAYFFRNHFTVVLEFPMTYPAKKGDAVFYPVVIDESVGAVDFQRIGEILEVTHPARGGTTIRAWIYPHARANMKHGTLFRANSGPENFEAVVNQLMDQRAKDMLAHQWDRFLKEQGPTVEHTLKPLLDKALSEYMTMVTPDIEASVTRRQPQFIAIVERHYRQTVEPKLFPVVEAKGMPLVELKLVPHLRNLGQEMWEHAPAAAFAWNAFRDKIVPWDSKTNLQERFDKWLRDEGMAIIEKHKPAILAAIQEIGGDLATDPQVIGMLDEAVRNILKDPALSRQVEGVIYEAIISNPKNEGFFKTQWNDPRMQTALRDLGNRLEWYINPVVDTVLLDRDNRRINPNLVWVLRRQILWKQDFWILVEPPADHASDDAFRPVPDGHRYHGPSTIHGN